MITEYMPEKKPFDWSGFFIWFCYICLFVVIGVGISAAYEAGKKIGYREAMSQTAKAIKTSLELTLTTLEDEKALIKLMEAK